MTMTYNHRMQGTYSFLRGGKIKEQCRTARKKSMTGSMMEHQSDPVPGGMRRKLGTQGKREKFRETSHAELWERDVTLMGGSRQIRMVKERLQYKSY